MTHYEVGADEAGSRLDQFLASKAGMSRSRVQKIIEEACVKVNDTPSKSSLILKENDIVDYDLPPIKQSLVTPEDISLDIVYEDKDVIVVNKPQGMVTHPGAGNESGTLVNALLNHCKDLTGIGGVERAGIVHRLDKDTSGLLVVAKNDAAHQSLSKQISERTAVRKYLALVYGVIKQDEGMIDMPIGRSTRDRKKMATYQIIEVKKDGRVFLDDTVRVKKLPEGAKVREATSFFKVIERFPNYTLVQVRLGTGRTHQIRLHMRAVGHPVVGDKTYGKRREDFNVPGQLLHAVELSFDHPVTGKRLEFKVPIPAEMERVIKL
ncbi:MAG: RluA family pseudouridine synthase, partial [bacterium]